jgi:sugar phosphate isomerase/epimerase
LRRRAARDNIHPVTSRREFLQAMAAASAATSLPAVLTPGEPAPAATLDRIGLELYTVRRQMAIDVDDTLDKVAAAGYREVEFAGYFNHDLAKLRDKLNHVRLAAIACHVGMADVEAKWDGTLKAAKMLGHKWVVVASVSNRAFASVDSLRELAARFNVAGRKADDAGIRLAYHNHDVEFKPVQGSVPYDILLAETNPKIVDFEMDIYWVTEGGADPLAYFAKYPGRFHLIHAKDSAGPPAHAMRDVGAGTIDWKQIFKARGQAGMEHVFVEHDEPPDPWKSVSASYKYLRDLVF